LLKVLIRKRGPNHGKTGRFRDDPKQKQDTFLFGSNKGKGTGPWGGVKSRLKHLNLKPKSAKKKLVLELAPSNPIKKVRIGKPGVAFFPFVKEPGAETTG